MTEKTATMDVTYSSGYHEQQSEFLTYDLASMIADVGGFLGLLLGHSLYGIFSQSADAMRTKLKK